jgi:crotonobetainyl-CoA:carnitine CoA-transferase CaiB-like acyl-CoA transferase
MTGPMEGIRVLDLSIMLTGPYAAALLGDQGAEVIKVEQPGTGDLSRWIGVTVNGMSALYLVCNRGKRCLAVDLKQPEGVEIVRQLARTVDVVIQNFRPGVVERLGLGYDDIRAGNPDVVYASLSGFGSEGPYRDRAVLDPVMQAYSGMAMNQADPADGVPVFVRQTVCDKVTAVFASQAITAALFARERGAGGQHVEISMADATVSFLWADSAANEVLVDSDGSMPSSVVAGFEPMRFADGWGAATPASDSNFRALCRAFGVEGYDDPRVATSAQRRKHLDVANGLIDMCHARAADMTVREAGSRFDAERLSYAFVNTNEELMADAHAVAVGLFEEFDHDVVGRVRLPRHPIRFGRTPAQIGANSPTLGQHTDELLEELGLVDRIADLRARGVIG